MINSDILIHLMDFKEEEFRLIDFRLIKTKVRCSRKEHKRCLGSLSSDSSGKLNVFGHNGDTLSVDSAQVGVFKETDEVSLTSFL